MVSATSSYSLRCKSSGTRAAFSPIRPNNASLTDPDSGKQTAQAGENACLSQLTDAGTMTAKKRELRTSWRKTAIGLATGQGVSAHNLINTGPRPGNDTTIL